MGWWSPSEAHAAWWAHRDQKASRDDVRDAAQLARHGAAAFALEPCFQSALYVTDCDTPSADSLLVAVGSHTWPDNGPGWRLDGARHSVAVPHSDERVIQALRKVCVRAGELLLWDSRTVHFGSSMRAKRPRSEPGKEPWGVPLWRPPVRQPDDAATVKADLDTSGVALVAGVAGPEECRRLAALFAVEMSQAFDVPLPAGAAVPSWKELPKGVWGQLSRGGGGWGVACCTRAAWEARLLPARVSIFKALLGKDDLVVSIDAVHWSPPTGRLCFMASFAPRCVRPDSAFKRKCVALATGRLRTTHHAHLGDFSRYSFGTKWAKAPAVSAQWRSPGLAEGALLPPKLANALAQPTSLHTAAERIAAGLTVDTARALLRPEISTWL